MLSRIAVRTLVVAAIAAGSLRAQAQPAKPAAARPATAGQHEGDEHAIAWKSLDTYHTVMAASWHPAKDRSDLAPFRARATELVAAARALAADPVPASCGGPARAADVTALLRASEEAARSAGTTGVADDQVKAALKLAHDRFHTLEEACSAPAGGMKH